MLILLLSSIYIYHYNMFPLFNDRLDIILFFFSLYIFNPHHHTHSYTHTHTAPSTTTTPGGGERETRG